MARFIGIIFILSSFHANCQSITISGLVTERSTNESIPYVNIIVDALAKRVATTNGFGFFSLSISPGVSSSIVFSHVGYQRTILKISSLRDTVITVALEPTIQHLEQITIVSENQDEDPFYDPISMDVVKKTPTILGEKDVLKALQLLPGVQRGIEGSTAFYVRGGGADQNLIIVDDATIYNVNHLFGFVSAFNPDVVKNINFYKGSFPARYGGRVASVTDIQVRDGSRDSIKAEGGFGILSGRLSIEGPLRKGKSSTFLISGRRSFVDLLVKPFMSDDNKEGYTLFDFNAKLSFSFGKNDRLLFNGFLGGDNLVTKEKSVRDQSTIQTRTNLGWINRNGSIRWTHVFTDKLFGSTSMVYSHYNFYLNDRYSRTGLSANYTSADFTSGINDYSIKHNFDYYLNNSHLLKSGLAFSVRDFTPRVFYSKDDQLSQENKIKQTFRMKEFNFYVDDTWQVFEKLSANVGLRASLVGIPGKNYFRLEPRAHLFYNIKSDLRINAGYTRSNQFMHLLSNTGVGLPTDLWVPVTINAPPQQGDLIAAGILKSFHKGMYNISLETYRRFLRNIVSYKQDAEFLDANELSKEIVWENNVAVGKGESYGTELFIEKKKGKITGWVSYTLAWSIQQFSDINYGKRFFSNYDRRHNIVLLWNFRISKKINLAANWLFSTGNALTVPQAYYYGNFATGSESRFELSSDNASRVPITEQINYVPYSGQKNSFRTEAYHRLDVSVQFYKKKGRYKRFWEFGIFNVYNRKNPFYYYLQNSNDFVNGGQRIDLRKKSLFPILPSISYNFKF